jgi:hypothetical protein
MHADYLTAVAVSPPQLSTIPTYYSLLQWGPLLPLISSLQPRLGRPHLSFSYGTHVTQLLMHPRGMVLASFGESPLQLPVLARLRLYSWLSTFSWVHWSWLRCNATCQLFPRVRVCSQVSALTKFLLLCTRIQSCARSPLCAVPSPLTVILWSCPLLVARLTTDGVRRFYTSATAKSVIWIASTLFIIEHTLEDKRYTADDGTALTQKQAECVGARRAASDNTSCSAISMW